MTAEYRLGELAERVAGEVRGDAERRIHGVATLEQAGASDLAFLTNPRYRAAAETTAAGAILVGPGSGLTGSDLLEVSEPELAVARLVALFYPSAERRPGISADARIGKGVRLGRDVRVEPFAVICEHAIVEDRVSIGAGGVVGERCRIGSDTQLMPRVVLYAGTHVGARCLLHSGVVLGGDGFGFATSGGVHNKIPQVGIVVVEDDVELGANATVDRAALGETRIGEGSKIDNLVMIAHGVRVGARALVAAQAGVAGSARLGSAVTLAGQSGVAGHLDVGCKAVVAAKSAVFDDLPEGAFVAGIPAVDHRRWKRSQVVVKNLPELRDEVRALRARVVALEARLGQEG